MKFDETALIKNLDQFRKEGRVHSTDRPTTEFAFQDQLRPAIGQPNQQATERYAQNAYGEDSDHSGDEDRDRTELLGLDAEMMEDETRKKIEALMDELGRTRSALQIAEGRIAYLEDQQDSDSRFSIMKERKFLAELGRLHHLDEDNHLSSSLILIVWRDFLKIRAKEGREAAYDTMVSIVSALETLLETGDLIGRLGDNIVGILSVAEKPETAQDRLRKFFDQAAPSLSALYITIHAVPLDGRPPLVQLDDAEKSLLRKMSGQE